MLADKTMENVNANASSDGHWVLGPMTVRPASSSASTRTIPMSIWSTL
jgi:hypothetical protein